jgi:hypothetical protein
MELIKFLLPILILAIILFVLMVIVFNFFIHATQTIPQEPSPTDSHADEDILERAYLSKHGASAPDDDPSHNSFRKLGSED